MGMFAKSGYETVEKEVKKQEERFKSREGQIYDFFLTKDSDEADVQFLNEEPVNYYEHVVRGSSKGKETFNRVPCTCDDKCPYCDSEDRPSMKSAYLVWDYRPFETTNDKGKKVVNEDGQLRFYSVGTRIATQLARISKRYGLSNRICTISRTGSGQNTTYIVDRGDENELSEEEIVGLLPEKYRDECDGSEESIQEVIKDQIITRINNDSGIVPTVEDDNDDEDTDYTSNLVGVEDDDEEDVAPKSLLKKKSQKTPLSTTKKSSAKSLLKKRK